MGASITLAGESLIAQKQASREVLQVARFILADVPGLDTTLPVDRSAGKPPAAQIVNTVAVTREGYLNPNQVVYSLMMNSTVGDFDFNWMGLETSEGVLLIAAYIPRQQKRKEIPPLQSGNNLTRNIVLEYNGAQSLTGIQVPASTWQFDFTTEFARLDARLDAVEASLAKKLDLENWTPPQRVNLDGPVLIYPGSTNTFKITDYNSGSIFAVATDTGTVSRSGDTITLTIASNAAAGIVTLDVTRDGTKVTFKIALGSAAIGKPSFVFPAANATSVGFEPTLTSSAFVVYPAGYDVHAKTRWQVSRNVGFTDLIVDQLEATNKLSESLTDLGKRLAPSTKYWARLMHLGNTLQSVYSDVISFTTASVYIRKPTITAPADGALKVSALAKVVGDAFSVLGGADTQDAGRLQISASTDFASLVYDSGWSTTQLTAFQLTTPLAFATKYYARIKYRGLSIGESEWSVIVSFTTDEQLTGTYTQLNGGATPRYSPAVVSVGNKLYVYGGGVSTGGAAALNDLWVYDSAANSWSQKASGGTGRYTHVAVEINGKIYVTGGYDGNAFHGDSWCYDIATDKWTAIANNTYGLGYCCAVAYNGKMYVYGGGAYGTLYAILRCYDPVKNEWTTVSTAPSARQGSSCCLINGKLYIYGGSSSDSVGPGGMCYDFATDKWTLLKVGPGSIIYPVAANCSNKMYIFGGVRGGSNAIDELWCYDPATDTWLKLPGGATPRYYHAGAAIDNKLYIYAGQWNMNDLWRIN
ncbi:Kelch repeat-containing protein [Pseudomonas sp. UBA1879]|uniref:Kelch repeat-containing protein n=1 Tax=Pseudomonas sp. UBA1879 TaxID=1947305 RepID=UPI0025D002AB|nr:kelch repeat-containing protein [Pseudomonas sp. UBA1879]